MKRIKKFNECYLIKENAGYESSMVQDGSTKFLTIEKMVDGEFVGRIQTNVSDDNNLDYLYFLLTDGKDDAKRLYREWKNSQIAAEEEANAMQMVANINRVETEARGEVHPMQWGRDLGDL